MRLEFELYHRDEKTYIAWCLVLEAPDFDLVVEEKTKADGSAGVRTVVRIRLDDVACVEDGTLLGERVVRFPWDEADELDFWDDDDK